MDTILSSRDNPLIRQVRELLGSARARQGKPPVRHRRRPAAPMPPVRRRGHSVSVYQAGGGNLPFLWGAGSCGGTAPL